MTKHTLVGSAAILLIASYSADAQTTSTEPRAGTPASSAPNHNTTQHINNFAKYAILVDDFAEHALYIEDYATEY